jgi:type I restriction-modification system DNA methylase subunit
MHHIYYLRPAKINKNNKNKRILNFMDVQKQPRTFDEEGILKILNEAIQIIFTELKSINPEVLQKTTGLLFASNLDYKTYKDRNKKEELIYDARRAASYILLDQLIFYNRLSLELPDKYPPLSPMTGTTLQLLKEKFDRVLQDNYSAIFISNIIPYLPKSEATIAAINQVIGIISNLDLSGKDILGKIFHRLIPLEIRKHIAAFYTSNVGGKILIELSIMKPEEKVLDLACGSGTLLVEAYKRKKMLYNDLTNLPENVLHQKLLEQLFGNDVVIFATHLATMNLALQSSLTYTDSVNICIGDGFQLHPGLSYNLTEKPKKQDFNGESEKTFIIPVIDVVTMNPPFTRHERVAKEFLTTIQNIIKQEGFSVYISGKMSLQHYFLLHADTFLQKGGRLAFVLPTNTFNVDLSEKLIQFLLAKTYHLQYLIAVNSKKGTFSEGCNFKEYLFIAEKGELTPNSQTKLIMFSDLPSYADVDKFLQVIREGKNGITTSENGIELSIKTMNTNTLYESNRWDTAFWDLNNKRLLNLFENEKFILLKDSQEFSFLTGFHSTHCEYLIFPNDCFTIERDLGDDGLEVKRVEDGEKVIIPRNLLRKCLREPKLYQTIYCKPSHWVLSIDRETTLPVDFFKTVLEYTAKKLSEIVKTKAEKGGKVKEKLDPFWYCHPNETGCNTKIGILWTFNRYGLWLRANTSFLTNEEITGNDGFHIYNYDGAEDKRIALAILNSWFNSSIHLYDFLRKCRVPAIHVQQVLKNDREEMFVPIISKLSKQEIEVIISATQKVAVTSRSNLLQQFDQDARKELDKIWLLVMGIPKEQQGILLKELYEVLKYVIQKR